MKLHLLLVWAAMARSWVWNGESDKSRITTEDTRPDPSYPRADAADVSRLPNIYAVAIKELQDLESGPLCHRIAARLLVNDCQLLEGKDEATVLTDSGRKVRDFVDFYAASLAICDLERGGFNIPAGCALFREGPLGAIKVPKTPKLHVSSQQIDACLGALAKSDSAWTTWVSYRHRALRFCEAARADNEKAQSIYLYQRITRVLENLANEIDAEMEKRLQRFNAKVRKTEDGLEGLDSRIDDLQKGVVHLSQIMSDELEYLVRNSADTARHGLEDTTSLQQMLSVLLSFVSQNYAVMAALHEKAVARMQEETEAGLEFLSSALASASSSSVSVGQQMEQHHLTLAGLKSRQGELEEGLVAIFDLAEALSVKYEAHNGRLDEANQKADSLLSALDDATRITLKLHGSIGVTQGIFAWWPYAVCPMFSLVLGSYRLPPSGLRNIMLIAVGEGLGYLVASANRIAVYYQGMTSGLSYHADVSKPNVTGSGQPGWSLSVGRPGVFEGYEWK